MLRCDRGKIEKFEILPNGFIRIDGTVANTGKLRYHDRDEYVTEEVLFDPLHVDSVKTATLTLYHPPKMITPKNYRKHTRGLVGGQSRKDGNKLTYSIVICDEEAIEKVKSRELTCLSMGYHCDTEVRGGKIYQINRRCNHVALVPRGRAKDAKLHLDHSELILPEIKPIEYITRIDLRTLVA